MSAEMAGVDDMTEGTGITVRAASPMRSRRIAYAASAWAFVFAAMHVYWTFGGRGLFIDVESTELLASDPRAYVIGNTLVSILFVMLGLLPLALTFTLSKSRGTRGLFRKSLLLATWILGAGMIIYGLTGVTNVLILAGIINDPFGRSAGVIRTNLFIWTPVWTLGGVLFTTTAWHHQRMC